MAKRADEVPATLLRLDMVQRQGINMPFQAARALYLSPDKMLPWINPDGVHFPSSAVAFNEEVLAQACELYGGCTSVNIDSPVYFMAFIGGLFTAMIPLISALALLSSPTPQPCTPAPLWTIPKLLPFCVMAPMTLRWTSSCNVLCVTSPSQTCSYGGAMFFWSIL